MLGFRARFAHLFGLSPSLATPRPTTPRMRVEPAAGTPAHRQALCSAHGGWRIIGRTPMSFLILPATTRLLRTQATDAICT
jgi:inhibitor of KinA